MPFRSDRHVPRRKTADDGGVQVNFITAVDHHRDGTIVVTTRGSKKPTRLRPLPEGAGSQLSTSLVEHLYVRGGTWTSVATLQRAHWESANLVRFLAEEHGITDLRDPDLTPATAWDGVRASPGSHSGQRAMRTFLADTLATVRTDGKTHQSFLMAHSLPVDVYRLEGYAPEVTDAIEKVARKHVFDWFQRHRHAVEGALGPLPKDWLWRPAAELHDGDGCPRQFRVSRPDLAAAMTLIALADDKGPNLSVIKSLTATSMERSSTQTSFVSSVKARNKRVLRTPADAGSLFSYGGLIEFVTAATRVERAIRDDGSDFSRLLFVATGDETVVDAEWVRSWWKTTQDDWPDPNVPRPASITFPRLRKAAALRGKKASRAVIGHSRSTRNLYLADALPDALLVPGVLDTQNSVTSHWRAEMTVRDAEADEAIETLATNTVMDVGVAVCASNGQSPTDFSKPCGLGPLACFTCVNGYRPPEVIPGLVAAVEFTDNIRNQSPTEWLSGEAPALNELARLALGQFPAAAVASASREDVRNARALIACVYLEGRQRD